MRDQNQKKINQHKKESRNIMALTAAQKMKAVSKTRKEEENLPNEEEEGMLSAEVRASKKGLGVKYDAVQKRLDEISRQYEEAIKARSRVIKELYEAIGNKPFRRGDRLMKAIKRGEGADATYFLREYKSPEDVENLD